MLRHAPHVEERPNADLLLFLVTVFHMMIAPRRGQRDLDPRASHQKNMEPDLRACRVKMDGFRVHCQWLRHETGHLSLFE